MRHWKFRVYDKIDDDNVHTIVMVKNTTAGFAASKPADKLIAAIVRVVNRR